MSNNSGNDFSNKKTHYFLLETGRGKELYAYYFFHKQGVTPDAFESDFLDALQQIIRIELYKPLDFANSHILDDFYLYHEAMNLMAPKGYIRFDPPAMMIQGNNDEDFGLSVTANGFDKDIMISDPDIFVLSAWSGIETGSMENRFFHHRQALSEIKTLVEKIVSENRSNVTQIIQQQANKLDSEGFDTSVHHIIDNCLEEVSRELEEKGFEKAGFHASFYYATPGLSKHLMELIGKKNFNLLMTLNRKRGKEIRKNIAKKSQQLSPDADGESPF